MGGFGSGRTDYATTPTDRDCLKLDVNEFTEILGEDGQYAGTYSWERGGDRTAQVGWRTDDEYPEELTLTFAATVGGDEQEFTQHIRITHTECNFGGTRPWWRCPFCSDRVAKLYAAPGEPRFACRECQKFGYVSSRASGNTDRTLRMRYNRIRKKLGGEPTNPAWPEPYVPDRPKGMHQDTYDDLVRDLHRAQDAWHDKVMIAGLQKYAPDDFEVQ